MDPGGCRVTVMRMHRPLSKGGTESTSGWVWRVSWAARPGHATCGSRSCGSVIVRVRLAGARRLVTEICFPLV